MMHEAGVGLMPKSSSAFAYAFRWGEPGSVWGSGVTYGTSVENAVIHHQLAQAGHPTSGISSTPIFERAKFYALHGRADAAGVVYTFSTQKLLDGGVRILRVADFVKEPSVPEDDEFVLVPLIGQPIPQPAIIEVAHLGTLGEPCI